MGDSAFLHSKQQIPRQTVNSAVQQENPRAAEYSGPDNRISLNNVYSTVIT